MNTGDTLQGDARTFKTNYLNPFPLPENSDEKNQLAIVEMVNKIISSKKEHPENDTTELERKIDQVVYELYGLSKDEIKLVEGS